ncbi:BnaC05g47980D [Brassica napus]|uniref:BnaC05g47980D protein n=1 Tax=Brassica napus TaxID=3708 RepID=A0A078INK4_BRANA|nr:BnaC05g47980D [Brassica napus]
MFFHMQSKTQTLETVLHGGSWLHGYRLLYPNCKKGYRVFVCYEVLTKEKRSRRVLCISKPYVVTSCICN